MAKRSRMPNRLYAYCTAATLRHPFVIERERQLQVRGCASLQASPTEFNLGTVSRHPKGTYQRCPFHGNLPDQGAEESTAPRLTFFMVVLEIHRCRPTGSHLR